MTNKVSAWLLNLSSQGSLFYFGVVALLTRLLTLPASWDYIGNEGAEYARIGESLLNGVGYVGLLQGPEIMQPPLYPILIAALTWVVGDSEIAGRTISIVAGTLLVLPIFLIAKHFYGEKAARYAALLIALHPLLVNFSGQVYTENLYLTLLLSGVYFGINALETDTFRTVTLSGLFIGLAYLTRPEAIAYVGLLGMGLVLVTLIKRKPFMLLIKRSAVLAIVPTVLATPYIGYLWAHTGEIRLEAKNDINFGISKRIAKGMNYFEASWGVSEDLSDYGPLLEPDQFRASKPEKAGLSDSVLIIAKSIRRNIYTFFEQRISNFTLGAPFILLLAILGLFREAWTRNRMAHEAYLLLAFSYVLFIAMAAQLLHFRYILPLLPFIAIWAGKGLEETGKFVSTSMDAAFIKSGRNILPNIVTISMLGLVIVFSITGLKRMDFGPEMARGAAMKIAGQWLNERFPGDKTVMDDSTTVSYYSKAEWAPLPYTSNATALKYIVQRKPDFIVLLEWRDRARPYTSQWINSGIPNDKANKIYEAVAATGEKILIYDARDLMSGIIK